MKYRLLRRVRINGQVVAAFLTFSGLTRFLDRTEHDSSTLAVEHLFVACYWNRIELCDSTWSTFGQR